jgi:malate synthase
MVLPDRNKIPHDVEFFQRLRKLMVATCHRRGALAIGGMTALFPSRTNQEVNKAALEVLFKDKMNEANLGMDGAWTGHPDQNKVAVNSFPAPNQITSFEVDKKILDSKPELKLSASGPVTEEGSREAIRTVLIYRAAVSQGKGAVLISNFMEDLATDRIYRIMLAQRIKWGHLTTDRFEEIVAEESEKLEVDNKQQIAQIVTDLIYNAKFNPE